MNTGLSSSAVEDATNPWCDDLEGNMFKYWISPTQDLYEQAAFIGALFGNDSAGYLPPYLVNDLLP